MKNKPCGASTLEQPVRQKRKLERGILEILNETRKDPSRLTWEEVMAMGVYVGIVYEAEDGIYPSYNGDCEFSQYLMRFAQAIESRVKAKTSVA